MCPGVEGKEQCAQQCPGSRCLYGGTCGNSSHQDTEWMVAFNDIIGTDSLSDATILRLTWEVYHRVHEGRGIPWETMRDRVHEYYTGARLRQAFIISYLHWFAASAPLDTKEHTRLRSAYQILSDTLLGEICQRDSITGSVRVRDAYPSSTQPIATLSCFTLPFAISYG